MCSKLDSAVAHRPPQSAAGGSGKMIGLARKQRTRWGGLVKVGPSGPGAGAVPRLGNEPCVCQGYTPSMGYGLLLLHDPGERRGRLLLLRQGSPLFPRGFGRLGGFGRFCLLELFPGRLCNLDGSRGEIT